MDILIQQLFREGSALLQSGNARQALASFRMAQKICPSNPTLLLYSGAALHDMACYDEAVVSYRESINIAPDMGEAHNNLGNSLMALGRFAEAADSFLKAAELLPASPVPLAARCTALQAQGKVAEAEVDCRRAMRLDPGFAAAHWNLALNLLLQGRYEEGWREYEWRWLKPDFTSPIRHADLPLWDGSPLGGRTILLHAEQGFGDAIQFVRYLPLVAECGGDVVLECHPQLLSLFRGIKGVTFAAAFGEQLPACNCQAPLLSLPGIFGTTLQTIPSQCPYLSVPSVYREKWAKLALGRQNKMKVGVVWSGKSYPDPLRSCQLAELAPLATNNSVEFYSLQVGSGAGQVDSLHYGIPLIDLTGQISNFADTAAVIDQLDLVISIDTAVAHLTGALGKPVFLMLPFAPDWRWLLDLSTSPWYPTMQIFRQKKQGDWNEVICRVHTELDNLANTKYKIL
jgi:Flp pilus assembly protein TadD